MPDIDEILKITNIKTPPRTFDEAVRIANKYKEKTGMMLENVPNPQEHKFYDIENRTEKHITWDKDFNAIEVTISADTGGVVNKRKLGFRMVFNENEINIAFDPDID